MKILTTIMILTALAAATTAVALAHGDEEVGDYKLVVGFFNEPAYEGGVNAASVRVTRAGDSEHMSGEMSGSTGMSGMSGMSHSDDAVGVEGLDRTLQVEVTYVPTSTSKTMDLIAVYGDPGHYVAYFIPTAPGHYRFRLIGTIEGNEIDETFESMAGGGDFDDVRSQIGLHFPEPRPSLRELESAVRGAQDMAQQAQIAAVAEDSDSDAGALLGIIGIVVGAAGVAIAAAALVVATRARNSADNS